MPTHQPGEFLLERYRIERLLGTGSFGEVYLALHQSLHTHHALKVLRRDQQGVNSVVFAHYSERFSLEARLGGRLNDAHIIQVHDFSAGAGELVLAMEYAPGGNLESLFDEALQSRRPLDYKFTLRLASDLAEGLATLHDNGIVHRDLTPANILFGAKGQAKIADLGIAQVSTGGLTRRTVLGEATPHHPGTPAYMSPEQESSLAALKPASDVYTLGVVLFQLLTLRSPKDLPPGTPLSRYRPDAPPELEALLLEMLSPAPEARPANGEALLERLAALPPVPEGPIQFVAPRGGRIAPLPERAGLRPAPTSPLQPPLPNESTADSPPEPALPGDFPIPGEATGDSPTQPPLPNESTADSPPEGPAPLPERAGLRPAPTSPPPSDAENKSWLGRWRFWGALAIVLLIILSLASQYNKPLVAPTADPTRALTLAVEPTRAPAVTSALPTAALTKASALPTAAPTKAAALPTKAAALPTAAPTAPPVSITVWHNWDDPYIAAATAVMSEYAKAHPGVGFVLTKKDDLYNTFRTAAAAGTGPDIVIEYNNRIWELSAAGAIVPLDEYKIDAAYVKYTYLASTSAAVMYKNKVWGLPVTAQGIALLYNKKLVGSQYLPKNSSDWSGLLSAAVQFQKDNPGKTLICNPGFTGGDSYFIAPVFFGHGVPSYVDESGKVYLNTREAADAMRWLQSISRVSLKEQSYDLCMAQFMAGNVGMWWTGSWAVAGIESGGVDYGILAMGRPFVGVGTVMLTRNAVDRKVADVAVDIMKHFASAGAQAKMAVANKTIIPAALDALAAPEVDKLPAKGFSFALQIGVPESASPFTAAQSGPVGNAVKLIWNSYYIDDALKAAQYAIESAVSKLR